MDGWNWCPGQESNLYLTLRRGRYYPLYDRDHNASAVFYTTDRPALNGQVGVARFRIFSFALPGLVQKFKQR